MPIDYGKLAFLRFAETTVSASISGGTLTLDLTKGNIFLVPRNAIISTLTISNVNNAGGVAQHFSIIFTANGSSYSTSWPASVKWPNNSPPTLTTTNGKKDVLHFTTIDGGTTWLGFIAGLNF